MDKAGLSTSITCGVDEAGRGPVIGPLVVSIVCGDAELMRKIGARDSKVVSRGNRELIYDRIIENSRFHLIRKISPKELNESMKKKNLNEIEEDAYAFLIEKAPFDCTFYVDSFDVNPERLSGKLSARTSREVVCSHKADSIYPTVSAASILSKVTRDRALLDLEKKFGTIGSGYPADPVTVDFLKRCRESGTDITDIARIYWKTYKNLFGDSRDRKLF